VPDSPIPPSFDKRIGAWEVAKPVKQPAEGKPKLKVKVRLNLHGIVAVESVTQIEEEEYEETVKKSTVAPAKVFQSLEFALSVAASFITAFLSR
jgi:Hsp70 protein